MTARRRPVMARRRRGRAPRWCGGHLRQPAHRL